MKTTATLFARSARPLLLAGAATLAFAIPASVYAQDAGEALPAADAPEAAEEGNEIVVTATKREQTLQDVPVAVSVTTAQTIERAQIRDLKDLSSVVPSLRVAERQSSANTNFLIRGFGNGANNAGIEPSVGVFIDGVYRSRSAAQIADLPDVQRVEVLRGPQSTLFGKNASAGVVSITTEKPKFSFGGNVEASYGNYNAMVIKGVVTGPVSETMAASLAAGYNKRDGYNQDLATGNKTNERNRWFVRGQLLYKGDSGLTGRLIADYGKIDENCCGVVNLLSATPTQVLISPLIGGKVNTPAQAFDNIVYNSFDSTNKIDSYGVSGQLDYEAGPLTFTSITAYRKLKAITNQDSDFTSAPLLDRNFQDLRIGTFTQEFRVNANFVDRVNALLGVFYFNEKIDQTNDIRWGPSAATYANFLATGASGGALSLASPTGCPVAFTTVPLPLECAFGSLEGQPQKYAGQFFAAGQGLAEQYRLKNDAFTVFAQVDFKITDRLTLTGGVNYTHDKKTFAADVNSNDAFAGIDFNNPLYAPLRNSLIRGGAIAQSAGTALGLGRNATTAEITALATGTSPLGAAGATLYANTIVPGATTFANANQNNPLANPLNAFDVFQYFPPFLDIPNAVESGKVSDSNVSYTARLAYDVAEGINVYLGIASGYKGASVNLSRDSRPTPADAATLGFSRSGGRFALPEKSTVYELGMKTNWDTGSINLAIFKQDIKGFQSNLFTGTGFFLANAEKQSVFGVEVEGTFRPIKPFTFGVSMTFLDPKYDSFTKSPFGDASGVRPADIPSFSGTVTAQYDHEMGNADHLILRADFHHESKVQVVDGLPGVITKHPTTRQPLPSPGGFAAGIAAAKPYTRTVNEMNASLTYAMQNGIEVTAWGRNITNNRYINTVFDSPAQTGSVSGYTNQPRTFGGSVRYRF